MTGNPETISHAMPILRCRQRLKTKGSRISIAAYKFGWLQGWEMNEREETLVAEVGFGPMIREGRILRPKENLHSDHSRRANVNRLFPEAMLTYCLPSTR
jgi:hypothetical protein